MRNKVLSPFPYYGGKAKMSPLICSLLDYERTVLYIEPFGGGCRTLLNKKPHEREIYNDFGFGLTNFFAVMTDKEKTEQLIQMLMDSPPSREQFQRLVVRRMAMEDRLNTATNEEVRSLALESSKRYSYTVFKELRQAIGREDYKSIIGCLESILETRFIANSLQPLEEIQYRHYLKMYQDFWSLVEVKPEEVVPLAVVDFDNAWKEEMQIPQKGTELWKVYEQVKQSYVAECARNAVNCYTNDIIVSNGVGETISDLEVAFTIFQLYYSSRDGMGTVWSNEKNADSRAYFRAVSNLRNVAERMQGVVVTQCDALDLLRQYRVYDNVMMYLDPSYLKPEDEHKNLGEVYKMSYSYQDHRKLLQEIVKPDTKAKILISNYDVDLYNDFLCDWKKTYYKTFTGVGSKKGNRRLEVLWQNY